MAEPTASTNQNKKRGKSTARSRSSVSDAYDMLENTEIAVDALTNYDLYEQVDNDFDQNFVSSEFIALKLLSD